MSGGDWGKTNESLSAFLEVSQEPFVVPHGLSLFYSIVGGPRAKMDEWPSELPKASREWLAGPAVVPCGSVLV